MSRVSAHGCGIRSHFQHIYHGTNIARATLIYHLITKSASEVYTFMSKSDFRCWVLPMSVLKAPSIAGAATHPMTARHSAAPTHSASLLGTGKDAAAQSRCPWAGHLRTAFPPGYVNRARAVLCVRASGDDIDMSAVDSFFRFSERLILWTRASSTSTT